MRVGSKIHEKVKQQSNPCTGLLQAQRLQEVQAPVFQDHRHLKKVRLPAIGTGRLYPPGDIPGIVFWKRLSRHRGQSAAGRFMSIENPHDTNKNRTCELLVCSAVLQPTAPQRASRIGGKI